MFSIKKPLTYLIAVATIQLPYSPADAGGWAPFLAGAVVGWVANRISDYSSSRSSGNYSVGGGSGYSGGSYGGGAYQTVIADNSRIGDELKGIASELRSLTKAVTDSDGRQLLTPENIAYIEKHNLKGYGKLIGIEDLHETKWAKYVLEHDIVAFRELIDRRIERYKENSAKALIISQILSGEKTVKIPATPDEESQIGNLISENVNVDALMAFLESEGGSVKSKKNYDILKGASPGEQDNINSMLRHAVKKSSGKTAEDRLKALTSILRNPQSLKDKILSDRKNYKSCRGSQFSNAMSALEQAVGKEENEKADAIAQRSQLTAKADKLNNEILEWAQKERPLKTTLIKNRGLFTNGTIVKITPHDSKSDSFEIHASAGNETSPDDALHKLYMDAVVDLHKKSQEPVPYGSYWPHEARTNNWVTNVASMEYVSKNKELSERVALLAANDTLDRRIEIHNLRAKASQWDNWITKSMDGKILTQQNEKETFENLCSKERLAVKELDSAVTTFEKLVGKTPSSIVTHRDSSTPSAQ
ncbi:MAG: hypothetical protein SGJ18_01605 [Pseudomonadota bacterium]|nr:hypothetical protein [Pseudomonadota bacterium]